MAKLWKGLRGIVNKKENKQPSDNKNYSVFSKEMTLKIVFVGGHQSGKTSIVRILNKQKFSTEYDPTIGIDQHKIRFDSSETKESLWIWDVSHAELGGVHESLIFHQAHGIVLVADLTNFTNIQAIDQWLHSISVYLKRLMESQHLSINEKHEKDKKKQSKETQNILIPRLYLLITKYDLSDEPILTDTQLHKFCKSNCIRAFARISSKCDKRNEMLSIFGKFSEDIIKHLPSKTTYHCLEEENDRFRYNYAIRRMHKNKIKQTEDAVCDTVFDLRLHSIKTFKWMSSPQAVDDDEGGMDNESDDGEDDKLDNRMERRFIAQHKLRETEQSAKRVLVGMRESIKLQKSKTLRDAKEYQRNLLKLKAMNQQNKEKEYRLDVDRKNESKVISENKPKETLLDHDVITCLKLDMINGLQQEIEHLTQIWEDELNTIAELIRFQIPLQRTNANLHRLKQQIIAREMLFKRRIRMVAELRTQNRSNVSQMLMMKQEEEMQKTENEKESDLKKENDDDEIAENNLSDAKTLVSSNTASKSFFSSLIGSTETVEALP